MWTNFFNWSSTTITYKKWSWWVVSQLWEQQRWAFCHGVLYSTLPPKGAITAALCANHKSAEEKGAKGAQSWANQHEPEAASTHSAPRPQHNWRHTEVDLLPTILAPPDAVEGTPKFVADTSNDQSLSKPSQLAHLTPTQSNSEGYQADADHTIKENRHPSAYIWEIHCASILVQSCCNSYPTIKSSPICLKQGACFNVVGRCLHTPVNICVSSRRL